MHPESIRNERQEAETAPAETRSTKPQMELQYTRAQRVNGGRLSTSSVALLLFPCSQLGGYSAFMTANADSKNASVISRSLLSARAQAGPVFMFIFGRRITPSESSYTMRLKAWLFRFNHHSSTDSHACLLACQLNLSAKSENLFLKWNMLASWTVQ